MSGSSHPDGEVVWCVVPLETPRVLRHCARCASIRPFASTDKFRLNAQQRHVDVWLLYACVRCDATWKREVLARHAPEGIDAGLYERFLRNDRDTAWRHAFASGERLAPGDGAVRVERPAGSPPAGARIRLHLPHPCSIRLDRLLARELGRSRGALQQALRRGDLSIEPGGERALRRAVRDGTVVVIGSSP